MSQFICLEAILVMCFCFIIIAVFGMSRNSWTYKTQTEWNRIVSAYMDHLITKLGYSGAKHIAYSNAIWSYNKMAFEFLTWDRDKMVNDRERYNEIIQFCKERNIKSKFVK